MMCQILSKIYVLISNNKLDIYKILIDIWKFLIVVKLSKMYEMHALVTGTVFLSEATDTMSYHIAISVSG